MAKPRSAAEQAHTEIVTEIEDLVAQIAAEEGPAPQSEYVSEDTELKLWGQKDPIVDHDTLVRQLMGGQVPPELLDPASPRPLALVKARPEYQQKLAEPVDEEMAEIYATLAEYPFRIGILARYEDDPRGGVKKSNSLSSRWRRTMAPEPVEPEGSPLAPQPYQPPAPAPAPALPPAPQEPVQPAIDPFGTQVPPAPATAPVMPSAPSLGLLPVAPPLTRPRPGGY